MLAHRIARYDIVEPVDDGTAMVELTSLPPVLGVDRIVVAPVGKLRGVTAHPPA